MAERKCAPSSTENTTRETARRQRHKMKKDNDDDDDEAERKKSIIQRQTIKSGKKKRKDSHAYTFLYLCAHQRTKSDQRSGGEWKKQSHVQISCARIK